MKGVGLGKRRNVDGQMASLAVESAAAVIESRAAGSSNEQYVNFYSGVARADRGPFVLSPQLVVGERELGLHSLLLRRRKAAPSPNWG